MKIFPLKLMSNYEKYKNLAEIMQKIDSFSLKGDNYKSGKNVNIENSVKQYLKHGLIDKYKLVIIDFLSKFKVKHA